MAITLTPDEIAAARANLKIAGRQKMAASKPQAPTGMRGALLNFLPTVAGGAGAAVGTLAGPLGTIAGGSVGSGLGEYLRQKLSGEEQDGIDMGNIVQEGAFGALPGVMKGLKGLKAGAKTATTTEAALQARKPANVVTRTSERWIGGSNGIKPGAKVGGRTLSDKRAKVLNEHISKNIGAKPTDATDTILRRNEAFIDTKNQELANLIDARNVPVSQQELSGIVKNVKKPVGIDFNTNNTHLQLMEDAGSVTDIKSAEQFRKNIDEIINYSRNPDSADPLAERVGLAWRKSLDDFVSTKIPESKPVKTLLNRAYDTKTFIEPAARNPGGVGYGGIKVGGRAMQSTKRVIGTGIDKIKQGMGIGAADDAAAAKGFRPFIDTARATIPQAGYRAAGTVAGVPFTGAVPQPEPEDLGEVDPYLGNAPSELSPEEVADTSSPFDLANIEANVQKILANGGTMKEVQEYVNLAKTMGDLSPKKNTKKTEAMRARDEAAALTDRAIQQLGEGSVDTGWASGKAQGIKEFFGQGDAETLDFNTTVSALRGAIAKARAGTSFTPNEEKLLNQYAPKSGDTGQQLRAKLQGLQEVFSEAQAREAGNEYSPNISIGA